MDLSLNKSSDNDYYYESITGNEGILNNILI